MSRARRPDGGAPAIGVAISMGMHAAVVGGLLWWSQRDKPAEPAPQGLELIWEQASGVAALAAEGAAPGAPPEVAAPEATPEPPVPTAPPAVAQPQSILPSPSVATPSPVAPPAFVRPPSASVAMPSRPPDAPPLPPMADAVLPPPPPPEAREATPETPMVTAAAPDVRVPPLSLPPNLPASRSEAPPRRLAPSPPRQAAAPRNQRTAEAPGAAGSEAAAVASEGSAVVRGITTAPSDDPSFPRGRPRYPPSALARGEQGTVSISMTVGPDGRVQAVRILRGSGHLALDEEARRHVLVNWRFRPASRDGVPVTATVETGIQFTLN